MPPMAETWRPARFSRAAMVLVAVTVVLVVAAGVLRVTGGPAGGGVQIPPVAVARQSRPASVPSSPAGGPPTTVGHDVAGAVSAARSIVAMEPALVGGDDAEAARLVAGWSARPAAAGLMDVVRRQRVSFAQAPGGPYSFEVAPLAARATSTGPDEVSVQLWCAEVVFAKGRPSYGSYVTESLGLVWQGAGWRLLTTSDEAGPAVPLAPGKAPTSIEEAASRLAGFGPVGLDGQGS
jgi:hypothetical protein